VNSFYEIGNIEDELLKTMQVVNLNRHSMSLLGYMSIIYIHFHSAVDSLNFSARFQLSMCACGRAGQYKLISSSLLFNSSLTNYPTIQCCSPDTDTIVK
jgi:hypothetical protein